MSLYLFLILSITEGTKKPPSPAVFVTSSFFTVYEKADEFFQIKNRYGRFAVVFHVSGHDAIRPIANSRFDHNCIFKIRNFGRKCIDDVHRTGVYNVKEFAQLYNDFAGCLIIMQLSMR